MTRKLSPRNLEKTPALYTMDALADSLRGIGSANTRLNAIELAENLIDAGWTPPGGWAESQTPRENAADDVLKDIDPQMGISTYQTR